VSDDGEHAVSMIAFVGSVFSPFYARARRRAAGVDPVAHCAMNVALYRRRGAGSWAMTEYRQGDVQRSAREFSLGANRLRWEGDALAVHIDERSAPLRRPVQGSLRLQPGRPQTQQFDLDPAGRHQWRPIAPCARIELEFTRPALRWQGHAYLDSNTGSAPLEADFLGWNWLRAPLPDGRTAVLYDGQRLDGSPFSIARTFSADGRCEALAAPPPAPISRSRWGVPRAARCEAGTTPRTVQSFEDGPFYARGLLSTRIAGHEVLAVHESLSLARFRQRWVQTLLPFRMRRIGSFWPLA
jgi:carotenoid 1,2-hydratase